MAFTFFQRLFLFKPKMDSVMTHFFRRRHVGKKISLSILGWIRTWVVLVILWIVEDYRHLINDFFFLYQKALLAFLLIDTVYFSGGNDYYRELNEQDYDMMLDDTPRGSVQHTRKCILFIGAPWRNSRGGKSFTTLELSNFLTWDFTKPWVFFPLFLFFLLASYYIIFPFALQTKSRGS